MGVLTLLRRRLGTHPLALTAVVVAALLSMVVVATLQLLSVAISDAGVRSSLGVGGPGGDPVARTVSAAAAIPPGSLPAADAVVRPRLEALADDVDVHRVAYPTVRGLRGGDARARIQLADITGLQEHSELVAGRWPTRTDSTVEVSLPEEAAGALGLAPGGSLRLMSLTDTAAPDLTVTVVGTYRVRDRAAAIWIDDPLSPVGVRETEFTTYGPLVLGPGVFETGVVGQTQVTWRASTRFDEATAASVDDLRSSLTDVLTRLRAEVGDTRGAEPGTSAPPSTAISDGRVETGLAEQLDAAALVAARIRASLLTPTVLLVLLGAASLVMAARLLTSLRADETRLMRTRGMSTSQVALLALADSGLIVGVGAVGAFAVAPLLTRAIGLTAGVELGAADHGDALGNWQLWLALVTMALLATVVVVATSVRSGRHGDAGSASGGGGRTPAALQFASGSGLDLALIGLGVLAVLQLRRYDVAGSATVDPLTIAAPACVIAGLSVLCLRALPGATHQVERVSVGHVGLDRAWGAWQLSRRLAAQGGTILLILLCMAMGALALSHLATAGRALTDQSAFETGSPVRVDTSVGRALAERAAGADTRAMPVLRETTDLRTVRGVSVLGVDATRAGGIVDPRPDTLAAGTWRGMMSDLARERPTPGGVALPPRATELTFTSRILVRSGSGDFIEGVSASGQVLLLDGRGMVTSVPTGSVTTDPTSLAVSLPQGDRVLAEPVSVIGFAMRMPEFIREFGAADLVLGLEVSDLRADGRPVAGTDRLTDQSQSIDLRLTTAASTAKHAPVVMTRALSSELDVPIGGTLPLPVGGRTVPAEVVALMDSVPTAADPTRAVIIDLPTLYATTDRPGVDKGWPTAVPTPGEWWLAPVDTGAAVEVLRGRGVRSDAVVVREDVEAARRANPVNAGMQGAMLLVTGAALVLAAVGFAATTASLARTRHHENAILLALGMPPARIRRVLTLERICVVVLTVLVGLVMGAVAAFVVVPFLVGGDGHAQVPDVLVVIPWWQLGALAGAITAVLSAIGVLVLRRTGSDLAMELRMGAPR
ncbi:MULTISPECIES: FtsX-like permease family protein [unclassified Knoellia]|uniref:FtsX-like permease family protein n=1 Tax=Knoellia altitudinis TaxID=3404795 RepID=UPI0036224F86